MDKHGLKSVGDFHKIEDELHSPTLSKEIMRKALRALRNYWATDSTASRLSRCQ